MIAHSILEKRRSRILLLKLKFNSPVNAVQLNSAFISFVNRELPASEATTAVRSGLCTVAVVRRSWHSTWTRHRTPPHLISPIKKNQWKLFATNLISTLSPAWAVRIEHTISPFWQWPLRYGFVEMLLLQCVRHILATSYWPRKGAN